MLLHRFIRIGRSAATVALAALALSACAGIPRTQPVAVEDVIGMSRQGIDASTMIAKMRESGAVYRLSGSKLAALKADGVPDRVLDYMQQTYLRAERDRQLQECQLGAPYFPVDE